MGASDSGKLCFTQLSWRVYWNRSLASSEPFHLFTQSINFYTFHCRTLISIRFSRPEVFLRKGVLKICSKSTGEHPCRSVISIKLLCNFIEIALRHGCSPVNLLHIFRTLIPRNTSGWLLLHCQYIKEYRCLNKVIHQADRIWTVFSFSNFYGKIRVSFCLNAGKCLFVEVSF